MQCKQECYGYVTCEVRRKEICDIEEHISQLEGEIQKKIELLDTFLKNNDSLNVGITRILIKNLESELIHAKQSLIDKKNWYMDSNGALKKRAEEGAANIRAREEGNAGGGYVATTRRVILNGGGQKRVVYKKDGKGDDYVKIGGAFVNLKRNFTKKR